MTAIARLDSEIPADQFAALVALLFYCKDSSEGFRNRSLKLLKSASADVQLLAIVAAGSLFREKQDNEVLELLSLIGGETKASDDRHEAIESAKRQILGLPPRFKDPRIRHLAKKYNRGDSD